MVTITIIVVLSVIGFLKMSQISTFLVTSKLVISAKWSAWFPTYQTPHHNLYATLNILNKSFLFLYLF